MMINNSIVRTETFMIQMRRQCGSRQVPRSFRVALEKVPSFEASAPWGILARCSPRPNACAVEANHSIPHGRTSIDWCTVAMVSDKLSWISFMTCAIPSIPYYQVWILSPLNHCQRRPASCSRQSSMQADHPSSYRKHISCACP